MGTNRSFSTPAASFDSGQRDFAAGAPPIGSIVAWFNGSFANSSNGTYTVAPGVTNNIAGANSIIGPNWRVCDGTAPNDAESPIFNGAAKFLPNLTDNRFIIGSTLAGSIGGSSTQSYDTVAHTHTFSTGATVFALGNHTHPMPHTHNFKHTHQWSISNSGPGSFTSWFGLNASIAASVIKTSITSADHGFSDGNILAIGGSSDPRVTYLSGTGAGPLYTTGPLGGPGGSGASAVTDQPVANATSATGAPSQSAVSGTTSSTGSATTFSIIPTNLACYYIIRIK